MQANSWRQKFIALSEDVFRELGFPPPSMVHEESLPLAMELEVEAMQFELLHSSSDQPEHVLITCKLGILPEHNLNAGLRRLLKANLILAREFSSAFGVHPEEKKLQSMFRVHLHEVQAEALLEKMRQTAHALTNWEQEFFPTPSLQMEMGLGGHQILA